MKKLCCYLFAASAVCLAYAGDVARFVDLGFSADGGVYVFGQYGRDESTMLPYAELYAVDVAKNDYRKVFKSSGSSVYQEGLETFEALRRQNEAYLAGLACKPAGGGEILYVRESEAPTADLEFRDFEHPAAGETPVYAVSLKAAQSAFHIEIARKVGASYTARAVIGNPSVKRAGVTGYNIAKILTDGTGTRLVFVIEKILGADRKNLSVRYMVETAVLR